MVAEHQLLGVRIEIELVGKVLDSVASDFVAQQRKRHDERQQASAVILDRSQQLAPLGRPQHFL